MPGGTFHSVTGGTFETVMTGTFHSATGGTFVPVMGGTFNPLPSPSVIFEAKDGKYGEDGSEAVER